MALAWKIDTWAWDPPAWEDGSWAYIPYIPVGGGYGKWVKLAYEPDVVKKNLYDAHTILRAHTDNNPIALPVPEQSFLGRRTGGNIEALTEAELIQYFGVSGATKAEVTATIGPTGDYATHAAAMAALPNTFRHDVTHTIETGTTLKEICYMPAWSLIMAPGGITYTLQAEKYYPAYSAQSIPVASAADATSLSNAIFNANDKFNDCFIKIVAGPGIDNGYVPIVDTIAADTKITVDSWPGTQPVAEQSYFIIVGAVVDGEDTRNYCLYADGEKCLILLKGIGFTGSALFNTGFNECFYVSLLACGVDDGDYCGMYIAHSVVSAFGSGIVANNTEDNASYAGVVADIYSSFYATRSALEDNNQQGILAKGQSNISLTDCIGEDNGDWGTYLTGGSTLIVSGDEHSGSDGDHAFSWFYSSTMTGNETFTDNGYGYLRAFLDGGGAARNFNPSGDFDPGFKVEIINTGDETITFDSDTLAGTVTAGNLGFFYYTGSAWTG